MDSQDLRTLQLLEALDQEELPSQRTLARKLNISLGLVNSFLKRLAHKGYFKVTNLPANRVKYILTPKGAAEKTKLSYEYIKYSFNFYQSTRERLKKLFQTLERQGVHRLAFYGAGELAEIAYLSLQESRLKLVAIADQQRSGDSLLGNTILSPEDLLHLHFDRILLTEIDSANDNISMLIQLGFQASSIVRLDSQQHET